MDKKSKILFIIFGLLILGSVSFTYWKIMVKRDYVIENQVDCDPYEEKCFIWECDSESSEEGEKCTGNPDDDIWYYKIARRKAVNIPLCNPEKDENCDPFVCNSDEIDCSETLCDDETKVKQGAECNNPIKYSAENPMEEEISADGTECEDLSEAEAMANPDCKAASDSELLVCEEGDETCAKDNAGQTGNGQDSSVAENKEN